MRDPVMLYKHPGKHDIHGDKFDYVIVEREDVEATLKQGWYVGTDEAKKAAQGAKAATPKPHASQAKPQPSAPATGATVGNAGAWGATPAAGQ